MLNICTLLCKKKPLKRFLLAKLKLYIHQTTNSRFPLTRTPGNPHSILFLWVWQLERPRISGIIQHLSFWNYWCGFHGGSKELSYHTCLCLCGDELSESKVVDKKWFIRIGCCETCGRVRNTTPWEQVDYSFIIKGKGGRGRRPSLSFLSKCHVFIVAMRSGKQTQLRRTMQLVECSLLHGRAQGRVSS